MQSQNNNFYTGLTSSYRFHSSTKLSSAAQGQRLFTSQKIISSLNYGSHFPPTSKTSDQIMSSLNSSFDGLFEKIKALQHEHKPTPTDKKQPILNSFDRFPKFNPQIKTPKVVQPTKPFEKIESPQVSIPKTHKRTLTDLGREEKSFIKQQQQPDLNYRKQSPEPKPKQKLFENGLMCIPTLKVSMDVPDELLAHSFKKVKRLEDMVTKQTSEEDFVILKSTIFEKKLTIQDFQLGTCVGSGKFGDVFFCKHKFTGSFFALKKIFKSTIKEHNMTEQFTRELKIHYRLNHPNIIKLYTHFDDEYHIFLLMEYSEGGMLMGKIKCAEEVASRYVDQAINAVEYLHSLKVAHRDIKPENIVMQFDTIKLCDFGWSSYYGKEMKTTFCGTLDYLSPEMKDRGIYDNSVDVWSIGILTYELLTGTAPYTKELVSWKSGGKNRPKINWEVRYPPFISPMAISFMRNILKERPEERANLRFCSGHYFITKYRQQLHENPYFFEIRRVL